MTALHGSAQVAARQGVFELLVLLCDVLAGVHLRQHLDARLLLAQFVSFERESCILRLF